MILFLEIYTKKSQIRCTCDFLIYFTLFFNIIWHISFAEFGFACFCIFCFNSFNFSLLYIIFLNFSSRLSSFFIHMAKLLFSIYSAFSSSCPGIGFIAIIGTPLAMLSETVIPPWFCYYNI